MAGLSTDRTISIYGTGAVGQALALELSKRGYALQSLINRTRDTAVNLENKCAASVKFILEEPVKNEHIGDILFLTVTDDAIADVAVNLARSNISFSHKTVVHCSGALDSSSLNPLQGKGADVAAMHPVQSFGGKSENPFQDIYFSLEGDQTAIAEMEKVASVLGARSIEVFAEDKPIIHASAAVASNFLVTLMHQAVVIAQKAGIEEHDALDMLKPLIQTTFENITKQGAANALTGPIARGDIETIKKHIELLYNDSELIEFYSNMGVKTCKLALLNEPSNKNEIKIIADLLDSFNH